jgi:lipopolysaccharide/colanic/teichoic acid biosynthesis glycosyltransferase
VLLVVAIAVRLDSTGPAVFRQVRVREHGGRFTMYKFRTMTVDAEKLLTGLQELNMHGADRPLFKMESDPRITRVGGLLRKTSLDELPQLVNVLKGQMSLVGPRPALPLEVEMYDYVARRRLAVKPGMTGLWQVSGRSRLSWDESIGFDLDYVDNWSPSADAVIAMRTFRAVVRRDGAL